MNKVVIIGSPNVGKSTLFNKLLKKRDAIACNTPGVTRDYKEGVVTVYGLSYTVIDTGGWSGNDKVVFADEIIKQIKKAVAQAALILFIVDNAPINNEEQSVALWFKQNAQAPIIVVVNKCEGKVRYDNAIDYFEDTIYISAEHNIGMSSLYDKIVHYVEAEDISSQELKVSIVGQPNAGKSTLMNKILHEDRMIVSNIPGTTRDSVSSSFLLDDNRIEIIDTAGMRRKGKLHDKIEGMAVGEAIKAVKNSDVIILVLDVTCGLERQDRHIIKLSYNLGKPLVIVANKWDLITENHKRISKELKNDCEKIYTYGVELTTVSALHDEDLSKVIKRCRSMHRKASRRIGAASLNKWLGEAVEKHSPPLAKKNKKAVKFKYARQVSISPIIIKITVNVLAVKDSYLTYLSNSLSQVFSLNAIPIKIRLQKNYNPYVDAK